MSGSYVWIRKAIKEYKTQTWEVKGTRINNILKSATTPEVVIVTEVTITTILAEIRSAINSCIKQQVRGSSNRYSGINSNSTKMSTATIVTMEAT